MNSGTQPSTQPGSPPGKRSETRPATEARELVAYGTAEVIDRVAQRSFMQRTNRHGLAYAIGHLAALGATGSLLFLALGSWWVVPATFLHGFVMAFLFAPVHECSHGTPFRNRRLNEFFFWLFSLIYGVPPTFFRYSHATHHTYTQIRGSDPDMVLPRRSRLRDYLWYVSGIPFWKRNTAWVLGQACGSVAPSQRYFLPDAAMPRVVAEARIALAVYAGVLGVAVWLESWAPLTFWIIPRLVGEPFMRWIRVAEHAECPEHPDLRINTRTTRAPGWLRLLFWQMPYHAEHHLCPKVPFHALPRLHAEVGHRLHPVGEGYFRVHGRILRRLLGRRGVTWEEPSGERSGAKPATSSGARSEEPHGESPKELPAT